VAGKVGVIIEKGEHGVYAWCLKLDGCRSQGHNLEQATTKIADASEIVRRRRQ
jgi:hypothetical protein